MEMIRRATSEIGGGGGGGLQTPPSSGASRHPADPKDPPFTTLRHPFLTDKILPKYDLYSDLIELGKSNWSN